MRSAPSLVLAATDAPAHDPSLLTRSLEDRADLVMGSGWRIEARRSATAAAAGATTAQAPLAMLTPWVGERQVALLDGIERPAFQAYGGHHRGLTVSPRQPVRRGSSPAAMRSSARRLGPDGRVRHRFRGPLHVCLCAISGVSSRAGSGESQCQGLFGVVGDLSSCSCAGVDVAFGWLDEPVCLRSARPLPCEELAGLPMASPMATPARLPSLARAGRALSAFWSFVSHPRAWKPKLP